MADVEMKDESKTTQPKDDTKKPDSKEEEPQDKFYGNSFQEDSERLYLELKKVLVLLEKSALEKDFR